MLRVLVCGGRWFSDQSLLKRVLDHIHAERNITTLLHGCAPGADTLADGWGRANHLKIERYPALCANYGRKAGLVRNRRMLIEGKPDLVIAFLERPIEESRGTRDMVTLAQAAEIEVCRFQANPTTMAAPYRRVGL